MQENEFERKVQQMMDTFEWRPSDTVWENLERSLKEKKRRRFVSYWLFGVLLLSVGGTAYYWMNTGVKQKDNVVTKVTSSSSSAMNDNGMNESRNQQNAIENGINSGTTAVPDKIFTGNTSDASSKNSGNTAETKKPLSKLVTSQDRTTTKEQQSSLVQNKKTVDKENPNNQNRIVDNSKVEDEVAMTETVQLENKIKEETITEKTKLQKQGIDSTDITDSVVIDSLVISDTLLAKDDNIIKIRKSRKMQWAVDISGGISSAQDGAFSFHQPNSALVSGSPQFSYGGVPQQNLPSEIKSGMSFSLGITGEISITERSSIAITPLYKYASERIKIGDSLSGAGGGLNAAVNPNNNFQERYQSGGSNTYTNKYHNAGVSIQYQWQVNKNGKTAMIWNAGITPLFLLSTNALAYDTASYGTYSHDKTGFRKFIMNASTGFYFKFGNEKAIQWAIGPQFSFQTASLMKRNVPEPKRFQLYSAVGLRIYLPKK